MYILRANAPLQKMFGLAVTLNIWKDIGNVIFPNGVIYKLLTFQNFGKTVYPLLSNYWKSHFSSPFQTRIENGWKYIIGNT